MTDDAALVVRVPGACRMLACSRRKVYRLIKARELVSFNDGTRKIVIQSIKDYIQRQIAADTRRKGGGGSGSGAAKNAQ